ncbi:MAG: hypothetical protein F6K19_24685 [Cyanothece sp. SIO1E1]|nr:hypothetical protein [Cyanothece sp. SIO1E1]
MSNQHIKALLKEYETQWQQFRKLRKISSAEAELALNAALIIDDLLAEQGIRIHKFV